MAVGDASPNEVDEMAYGLKGPLIAQLPSATGADDGLPMAARPNKECGGSGIVLEVNFDEEWVRPACISSALRSTSTW